ncbi:MAG: heavy-metal-associated domain-containing protein [Atopostipes suicloacalis]|nr:heavy-metal-associated domain-containing protein [Atopostipes suicloacalis]
MKKEVTVDGMTCEGCANTVRKKFEDIQGVEKVEVNRSTKNVSIESSTAIDEDTLVAALSGTNYSVVKASEKE